MRKQIFLSAILVTLTAACGQQRETAGGGGTDSRANKPVTLKGSDTMVILGQRFAEEYMKRNPGTVIQVNGGGSGTGIAALINGTVDVAQSSRAIKEDEKAQVEKNRNAQLVETSVALDALAVFVHQTNPVKELTIAQVAQIFTGKLTNWRQVGGPNKPIVLYGRESSSGTYDYFKEHVLKNADFAPAVQNLAGTAAIINAVSADPNAIGYGGIAYASGVRALGIRDSGSAVQPSEATVADGTYPLSRSLFFYSLSGAPERITRFVEWVVSPDGQSVVENVGYFPLSTAPATPDASS